MDDASFRRLRRQELVDDRVSGASQLARQALDGLGQFAASCTTDDADGLREQLLEFAEDLQYARPNMAPIFNLVQRWVDEVDTLTTTDLDHLRQASADAAMRLSQRSLDAVTEAAERAAGLIGDNAVVVTHSLSTTVQEAFRVLAARGHVRAIVTESRPGFEGRNQARHLDRLGVPVTYITDAQLGHFVRDATVALVGADMLLTDGAVVNKAGTYLLALAARDRDVPVYACCESFKASSFSTRGFELEELDSAELEAPRGRNIRPRNVYFDITPARLIDAWITEEGVVRTPPGG